MSLTKLRRTPSPEEESFFVLILRFVRYTRSETICDLQFCWTKHTHYFVLFKNDTKKLNFSAQARLALPREPA